jgi:CBS domain-containing protein
MKYTVQVGEVMKKDIKKVDMDDSIELAAKIMRDERIGSVVVVGEKNVKGIVTTSDIVYKHVAQGSGGKVKDIMTTGLITIDPSKSIEEAANMMVEKKIEKLLVFDMGKMVGIITNNDIIRVEPALFEILLERLKMGARDDVEFMEDDN